MRALRQKQLNQKQSSYQLFLDSLANPQTRTKYDFELKCYLRYLDVNADKLITPRLIDSPVEIRKSEDKIIEYLKYLATTEKLAPASINVRLAAIIYFYTINRITINRKYVSRFKPAKRKVRKGDFAYTHEQIGKMVNKANTRDKMIVLLMAATGMRIGALCKLTINNLQKVTIEGYPSHVYKIVVYEGEPEQYYCFTTFELAAAIDDYLKEREHFGEQLKPEAPLIRADYNHVIPERSQQPEFLTTMGMQRLLDRLLISCRIRVQKHGRELHTVMKSHGYRKFAITQMKLSRVDYNDREFLVGHKVSRGLDTSYDRTSEEDRLKEFLKAIDLLTISPENRLRKQVAEQDYTIQTRMKEKDVQIQQLIQQMNELRESQDEMKVLLRNPKTLREMISE